MAETVQFLDIEVRIRGAVLGEDGAIKPIDKIISYHFTEGTGSNQIGSAWEDRTRTLNTTSEDLDVRGGLTDFQGVALDLNVVKVVVIHNQDTDSGDYLLLKQGSANPMTTILGGTSPTLKIGPLGLLVLVSPVDGYAATAGSADKLAVEAVDNSTYYALLAGDNA